MIYKFFSKLLTKRWSKIPLFIVTFNYNAYLKNGKKNSCLAKIHPLLIGDKEVERMINQLIDYIRDVKDLEELL